MNILIHGHSAAGEELEEEWPSIDAFRNWATADHWVGSFTAYEEDEDGDFIVIYKGIIE